MCTCFSDTSGTGALWALSRNSSTWGGQHINQACGRSADKSRDCATTARLGSVWTAPVLTVVKIITIIVRVWRNSTCSGRNCRKAIYKAITNLCSSNNSAGLSETGLSSRSTRKARRNRTRCSNRRIPVVCSSNKAARGWQWWVNSFWTTSDRLLIWRKSCRGRSK